MSSSLSAIQCDILVLGAGVAGSHTAYAAACAFPNSRIVLLEQFDLLHNRGSSHGNSRIIRYAYNDPVYSEWGVRSLEKWKKMEEESGMKVYHRTGGLDFGPADGNLRDVMQVCKQNQLTHEVLSPQQMRERFPNVNVPPESNYLGVYQPDAGVLNATEGVRMALYLAMRRGVTVKDNERILDIIPMRSQNQPLFVVVRTSSGATYITKKLCICAGAWTKKCLQQNFGINVDLEVQRMSYFHWKLEPQSREHWQKFPIWIHWSKKDEEQKTVDGKPMMERDGLGHYGIPALSFEKGVEWMKSGAHFPVPSDRHTDPDNRSFTTPQDKVELTRSFLRKMFRGVEHQSYEEMRDRGQLTTCLYTMTKDDDFIIDTVGGHDNIVIFAGGSGHSYKFGPVLGECLGHLLNEPNCELLLGKYSREKFSLKRQCVPEAKL